MNLELNNHKITLGPKALAFIETAYRAKGEYLDQCAAIYCRDQLALWRAGGKCDADVTIEGPARFVAKGNEIGIPMKAGEAPVGGTSTTPRVGSGITDVAAPADLYEPVGTMPVVGDKVRLRGEQGTAVLRLPLARVWDVQLDNAPLCFMVHDEQFKSGDARILKRQPAKDTGLQVYRQDDGSLNIARDDAKGSLVLATRVGGRWHKERTDGPDEYVFATRITGPAADAAIKEAREQGVI